MRAWWKSGSSNDRGLEFSLGEAVLLHDCEIHYTNFQIEYQATVSLY